MMKQAFNFLEESKPDICLKAIWRLKLKKVRVWICPASTADLSHSTYPPAATKRKGTTCWRSAALSTLRRPSRQTQEAVACGTGVGRWRGMPCSFSAPSLAGAERRPTRTQRCSNVEHAAPTVQRTDWSHHLYIDIFSYILYIHCTWSASWILNALWDYSYVTQSFTGASQNYLIIHLKLVNVYIF